MNTEFQEKSIISLARDLIKIPSQSYNDTPNGILDFLGSWLSKKGINHQILRNGKDEPVGLMIAIDGKKPGPVYCLNACIDTAPFGDIDSWSHPPDSAYIQDDWLYGRGSADCKTAVSIFVHIAQEIQLKRGSFNGNIHILFDADEHTGRFGGIKNYVGKYPDTKGIMIGYPGEKYVNTGARGFYRVKLKLYGSSGHTGSSLVRTDSALDKTRELLNLINNLRLPEEEDASFGLHPKVTVTSVHSGDGYSIYPNASFVNIDFRLTPSYHEIQARETILEVIAKVDALFPGYGKTGIEEELSWPPYMLSENDAISHALLTAANEFSAESVQSKVCGPSNIGNFLTTLHIPATCGFGLKYKNIHAPDECVFLPSIRPTYFSYKRALEILCHTQF